MSSEDRRRWEERHRERARLTPRESVLSLPRAARPGAVALDLACGQGRHTAALAAAGYRVVAMDIASTALAHSRATAPHDNTVLYVQADVDAWPFAADAFDLVVQVDFLERKLFADLRRSVRRGGLLLIDTFLDQGRPNAEGPSRPEFLLKAGELRSAFDDFDVVRNDEVRGDTARAVFVGRRR